MTESLEKFALNKNINKQGLIHKVGLIGCGDIGQQVARIVSQSGIDVVFVEINPRQVENAMKKINLQLDGVINHWGLTQGDKRIILSRIRGTVDYEDIRDCNLIIEVISSNDPLNERIVMFKKLENYVSDQTVITSSVSTLMITDIAAAMKHPERALALNFITSPAKVRIVEIVCGLQTNEQSHQTVQRFAKMINKEAITVNESPGSVSTRLIVTLINEACNTLMEGVSTVENIDTIMKRGFGMQHGPFELADRIGLDKVLRYMEQLYQEFGLSTFKASPLIKRLVRARNYGIYTSKGFYLYDAAGQKIGMNVSATQINTSNNNF
ncbi:MAG: 3-hydroxyacyl-CoA dehydrogenase family protein [Bacteroidales bacterium]|jgi:3-hydroxybutyryl-CoA dehydrogenase|nr:3-hydroxyacyl-CoA dehydrogenase family protein [Bacteroidales bacterium]